MHPPDPDTDPSANLADRIDEPHDEWLVTNHTALDGTPHVLAEDAERLAADLWVRDRQAEVDEANAPGDDDLRGAA
ncbi:unnamed protein product [Gemmataceae bacterium]|nr:unnamed protein product [Gemmataceae bacterium]VTT99016.1 unnamed protein product [Gemmataceae bacterium]